jgi:hypothetical protein
MISILTDSGAELATASRRQIVYKAQGFNPGAESYSPFGFEAKPSQVVA